MLLLFYHSLLIWTGWIMLDLRYYNLQLLPQAWLCIWREAKFHLIFLIRGSWWFHYLWTIMLLWISNRLWLDSALRVKLFKNNILNIWCILLITSPCLIFWTRWLLIRIRLFKRLFWIFLHRYITTKFFKCINFRYECQFLIWRWSRCLLLHRI